MDSKPYASLSSGLLARKGGAKPAMRPQGFNNFGGSFEDLGWNDMGQVEEIVPHHVPSPVGLTPPPRSHAHAPEPVDEEPSLEAAPLEEEAFEEEALEEDASEEEAFEEPQAVAPPISRSPIAPPPVVEQQRALRESYASRGASHSEVVALPRRRAAPAGAKTKAAFTLRLDPERHLKLRLASAVTRMSAQQLVTGALDEFLNSLPELDGLADRLPAEAGKRRR